MSLSNVPKHCIRPRISDSPALQPVLFQFPGERNGNLTFVLEMGMPPLAGSETGQ